VERRHWYITPLQARGPENAMRIGDLGEIPSEMLCFAAIVLELTILRRNVREPIRMLH